jgi:hypothetical protein
MLPQRGLKRTTLAKCPVGSPSNPDCSPTWTTLAISCPRRSHAWGARPVRMPGREILGIPDNLFSRTFQYARTVEGDRLANQRLEGGLADFFAFVDVDCTPDLALET